MWCEHTLQDEFITSLHHYARKDVFFVSDNSELFRNELIAKLESMLPPEQLRAVLAAFDTTSASYQISRQQLDLIATDGFPEPVKWYLASKAVANRSPGTVKQYRYKLLHFFDTVKKPFQDIRPNDIRVYLFQFKKERNASDCYLESVRITLNGFFGWLVANEYLMRNPCANVEKIHFNAKRREPLSMEQLETLRWNVQGVREKALIDFLFSTGCRVSECADVRLSDIGWKDRSVLIRHGKGDKERIVYFNAEALVSMRKYIDTRQDDTDALFVSVKAPHAAIGAHALENIISKVAGRTDLHVFPHKLRHTFATAGMNSGMPLHVLQQLMGHAKPETTMIYAKQMQEGLRAEHQRVYA